MFDFFGLFGRKKLVIDRHTKMGDMLDYDPELAQILMQHGMHCVGCPSSRGEALETACQVHGMDVNQVLDSIHKHLDAKGK